ncbi:MAG: metallophosphoesterase [Rubrivivax sp.]|nr:metallophosphoesterase [Rubrivivax sp.]
MSGDSGGLLQISDPHFGTEQPGAADALVRLVAQRQPVLVVLSGDITQRATATQFAAARQFVQRLAPAPVLAMPGNHDIPLFALWARVLQPYGRYEKAFGPARDVEFAAGHWHVVALNTTRPWRHKHGEVSARQIAQTAARLRAAEPAAIKIVVTHQPVALPVSTDPRDRLRGAPAALAAWHAAGADLVLGGHIHLACVMPLFAPPRPMWAVQAGTALSTRVRSGMLNSVTELLVRPGDADRSCVVRFWEWAPGQRDFKPQAAVTLPLAAHLAQAAQAV